MDKYDYITATIPEEKERLEKIISFLTASKDTDSLLEYKERYNNIVKYLSAKDRYLAISNNMKESRAKLENLKVTKEEYSVDNILLEDTLLTKFHEDTGNEYRNLLYENIKYQDESIRDILYLLFEKESNYSELVIKRNRLKEKLDRNKFPQTYSTLLSQSILIEKQDSILDEIFIAENNLKINESKLSAIEESIMTDGILKILYEFWIIDSYDPKKVDRHKLFADNKAFIDIKNNTTEPEEEPTSDPQLDNYVIFPGLNLPGLGEKDNKVDINGKDYLGN